MATERRKPRPILCGALATGAILATLWYGRTYPPTLTGVWSHQEIDSSETSLTLHAAGRGYFKRGNAPEQIVRWSADGEKITVTFDDKMGSLFSGVMGSSNVIATQTSNPNELSLDLGERISLHRTE